MRLFIYIITLLFFYKTSYTQELKWLIPPTDKFEEVSHFSDGLARVKVKGKYNSKYGFINTKGETVIPFKYNHINNFSEGLARYGDFRFWNFIDTTGKLVLSNLEYDIVSDFQYGRSLVSQSYNNKGNKKKEYDFTRHGYIDKQGKIIIPAKYRYVTSFHPEIIGMNINGKKAGILDSKGKVIIPFEYESFEDMSEDLIASYKNGKMGFINLKNEIVIPFEFKWVREFSEGFASVKKENCHYFINKKGETKINLEDVGAYSFRNGLAVLEHYTTNSGSYAIIDTTGKFVIPFDKFDNIWGAYGSEKLIPVQKDEKWGYTNYDGEIVIPLQYTEVELFSNTIAKVRIYNKIGFINKNGKTIIPIEYDDSIQSLNNTIWLKKGNKWGLVEAPSLD